jgi:transcriptional regulator GlxA family with amidase domain
MTPHRVVVLALGEVIGYDLSIPPLIFREATDEAGQPRYDVRICGLDRQPIRVVSGYTMVPDHGREALAEADTVVIPGTRIAGPRRDGTLPPEVGAALALIPAGARIMSICTGAFVLAAAGLLDGRPATTHWAHTEAFRRLYPNVLLDENVLFVDDGDVLTSAGLGAGVDLCLHVVRTDHGSEVANRAARYCVVPPWRDGGQSQFIDRAVPESGTDGTAPVRAWALRRLHEPLDLAGMAGAAAGAARPAAAGDHGAAGGPGGGGVRPGHGRVAATASAGQHRRVAAGLSQDVPGKLTQHRQHFLRWRVLRCGHGAPDARRIARRPRRDFGLFVE